MAAESSNCIEFGLEPDTFRVVRKEKGVEFWASQGGDLQLIFEDLSDCQITDEKKVSFIGRDVGVLDEEVTCADCGMDVETIISHVRSWFPTVAGNVHHITGGMDEFNQEIANNEFVCAKFSAEWCGPCKMIAPQIKKMSAQYPNVRFLHIDVDEQRDVKTEAGIKCMPTFIFWKDGQRMDDSTKIEGANVAKIEALLKQNNHEPQELPGAAPFDGEVSLKLTMESDMWKLIKKDDNTVDLAINGEVARAGVGELKVDVEKGTFKFGNSNLKFNPSYDQNQIQEIADQIKSFFPTNVIHVHNTAEFDQLLQENSKVIGKFSADWCGPCHAIAPTFTALSIQYPDIKMVHIDVDSCKELSTREGVQAMPTFKFYLNGAVLGDLQVRGANKNSLKANAALFMKTGEN